MNGQMESGHVNVCKGARERARERERVKRGGKESMGVADMLGSRQCGKASQRRDKAVRKGFTRKVSWTQHITVPETPRSTRSHIPVRKSAPQFDPLQRHSVYANLRDCERWQCAHQACIRKNSLRVNPLFKFPLPMQSRNLHISYHQDDT